eukprot:1063783-Alexandrium_andersonii.AAC.1
MSASLVGSEMCIRDSVLIVLSQLPLKSCCLGTRACPVLLQSLTSRATPTHQEMVESVIEFHRIWGGPMLPKMHTWRHLTFGRPSLWGEWVWMDGQSRNADEQWFRDGGWGGRLCWAVGARG